MEEVAKNRKKRKKKTLLIVGLIVLLVLLILFVLYYKFFIYDKKITSSSILGAESFKEITFNNYSNDDNYKCGIVSISIDGSLTFREDEIPIIGFADYGAEVYNKTVNISIYSLDNSDEYLDIVSSKSVNTTGLKLLKNVTSKIRQNAENERSSYFDFEKKLEKGYYLAKYNIDGYCKDYYQLIQVSNISAYVGNTERDVLVWTMDPASDKPIENANISYNNRVVKTDENGLVTVSDLIKDNDNSIKYLKISNKGDEILVSVADFSNKNYYTSFIYTDRPLYKTTDTIKIWGFVPVDLFIDKITEKFIIKFNNKEYEVTPNEDGIFILNIAYKDYKIDKETKGIEDIDLYYNDVEVATAEITIEDYTKPDIEYSVMTNKNNYYLKDTVGVTVKSNYLTGEPNVNKTLYLYFNGQYYDCVTDENGICTAGIDLSKYKADEDYENDLIIDDKVYLSYEKNLFDEIGQMVGKNVISVANIKILNRDIELTVDRKMIDEDKYYFDLNVKKITIVNDKFVYTKTNKNVDVRVIKNTCKASTKVYYEYNPYTKKNRSYTLYNDSCDLIEATENVKDFTTSVTSGYKEFTNLNYLSTSDKQKEYILVENYDLEFETTDSKGNEIIVKTSTPYQTIDNYYLVNGVNDLKTAEYSPYCNIFYGECMCYPILSYKNISEIYSIGDKIDLRAYSNDVTKKTEGTKLSFAFKEKVLDTYINDDEIEYKNNYFPGVDIGGAYYDNATNNMYLIKRNYLDYDETDRKANIDLKTDSTEYTANGKVTLNIKVTDKDNKGIKTNVLISVVDEAIFLLEPDRNEEIETIYNDKNITFQQYSTHFDLPFFPGGSGATGEGPNRSKQSDTIYFNNIKTDDNGVATVTFNLNELETKFRITAIAVNNDLYYGTNVIKIISKK